MRTLFLVKNIQEAQKALVNFDKKLDKIIAFNLEVEFYLKSKITSYNNPLYKFLDVKGITCNYNFLLPNFEVAYKFAKDENLVGLRDRLGYFFSEFDRSYLFATRVIDKLKPKEVFMGTLIDFPGSSVINGSLKIHAFDVVLRERGIAKKTLMVDFKKKSLRQVVGRFLNRISLIKKTTAYGSYDLVILAPPRHVLQLKSLIDSLRKLRYKILILTYTVSPTNRSKLKKHIGEYFEKERFLSRTLDFKSTDVVKKIIKARPWDNFFYTKYSRNTEVMKFLKWKIKKVISSELLENIKDEFIAGSFFDHVYSRVLLTTTDPDSKVIHFIESAKKNKVRTIALQHGILWNPAPPSVAPISDLFVAWSTISKHWVKKIKSFQSVRVLIGQYPFHLELKKIRSVKKTNKIRILYLVTIVILDLDMVAYYRKKLFAIFEQIKNAEITVRIHPFQEKVNLAAIINNFKGRAEFDKNENLFQSIADSDIVIYEETTAGFNAMLARKPTIFFNPFSGEDYFNAKTMDYSMSILSELDIEKSLEYFVKSPKWDYYSRRGRKFALKYLGIQNSNLKSLTKVLVSELER